MECQLQCTQCGKRYPLREPRLRFGGCGEPLEAAKKLIGNGYLKPADRIVHICFVQWGPIQVMK